MGCVVALPVALGVIGILPQWIGRSGGEDPGETGVRIDGSGDNIVNTGTVTVMNNISVIAQEYQKETGQALSDNLRQLIEQAVAAAKKNDDASSVRLYEQIASRFPFHLSTTTSGSRTQKTRISLRRKGLSTRR